MQSNITHLCSSGKLQYRDDVFLAAVKDNILNGGMDYMDQTDGSVSDVTRSVKFLTDFFSETDREELVRLVELRIQDVAAPVAQVSLRDEKCVTAIYTAIVSKMASHAERKGYTTSAGVRFGKMREIRMTATHADTFTEVEVTTVLAVAAVVAAVIVFVAAGKEPTLPSEGGLAANYSSAETSAQEIPKGLWPLPLPACELRLLGMRMLSVLSPPLVCKSAKTDHSMVA